MSEQQTRQLEDNRFWKQVTKLIPYADPWEFPDDAFYDVYGVLDQLLGLTQHTQLEGRRGSGKTVLLVRAYLDLREGFEKERDSPPYEAVSIFIDLKRDVAAPKNFPPMVRALMLYRQILAQILTVSSRSDRNRKVRRFWGLEDFLDERPNWFRRTWARWHLIKYRSYLRSLGDKVVDDAQFQQIKRWQSTLGGGAGFAAEISPTPKFSIKGDLGTKANRVDSFETRISGVFQLFAGRVSGLLDKLLEAMQVDNLVIFLDEWSDVAVGVETQPFLYELLTQTFPSGGKVSIKLATIPGSTQLTLRPEAPRVDILSLDNLAFSSKWVRKRLLHLLMRNLVAVTKGKFPRRYYTEEEVSAGFPLFRQDFFLEKSALDEFIYASENLPRQMLLIFIQSYRLCHRYVRNNRQLSAPVVKLAAKNYFDYYQFRIIKGENKLKSVFEYIIAGGHRVIDVEIIPEFREVMSWFVDEGVLFKCDKLLEGGYSRYILSYPAEAYRQFVSYQGDKRGINRFEDLEIQVINDCGRYLNAPEVHLSELVPILFKSQKEEN
jgi:hypothetical protein